jgi:hypothetical protein
MMMVSLTIFFYLCLLLNSFNLPYSLLVFAFAVFEPLCLTFASLILSDTLAGLFAIALLYHSSKFYNDGSFKHLLFLSIVAGLGIVAKFSFLPVLIAYMIGILIILNKKLLNRAVFIKLIKAFAVFVTIVLLVINLNYPSDKRFRTLKEDNYKSRKITAIQQTWLGEIPIPFPQNLVQAADLLSYHSQPDLPMEELTSNGGVFIFNRYYERDTVWYYYWAVLLFKSPLFVLLLFFTGAMVAIMKWKQFSFHTLSAFIIIFFLFYGGFFNPFQIGSRHLMAIYPLLFVTASLSPWYLSKCLSRRKLNMLMAGGTIWFLISVAYYFPHTFYYTNELILNKKEAHLYFAEGVNDYVLSGSFVQDFMKKNPQYKSLDEATSPDEPIAVTLGTLNKRAFMLKEPLAMELWKRKPDDVKRFVLLIFNEPHKP